MTSREPGQCPGIWDSVIHKDMVTDERETDRGQRQSLESVGEEGWRERRGRGKKLEGETSGGPRPRSVSLRPGPRPLQSPPFLTRTVQSLRVPGELCLPSLAAARMAAWTAMSCCEASRFPVHRWSSGLASVLCEAGRKDPANQF